VETGPGVYDIPLWVLLPKRAQASNLLVVAAPSASHIGMSTLRMEPQFMIMGQGCGVLAALAVEEAARTGKPADVHNTNTDNLHQRLLAGRQLMNEACQGPRPSPSPPSPPAPHSPSIVVTGAGASECNGIYRFDPSQHRDPGTGMYVKDDSGHAIYRLQGVWRVAHDVDPLHLFYVTGNLSQSASAFPPAGGWRAEDGAAPVPKLANGTSTPMSVARAASP